MIDCILRDKTRLQVFPFLDGMTKVVLTTDKKVSGEIYNSIHVIYDEDMSSEVVMLTIELAYRDIEDLFKGKF